MVTDTDLTLLGQQVARMIEAARDTGAKVTVLHREYFQLRADVESLKGDVEGLKMMMDERFTRLEGNVVALQENVTTLERNVVGSYQGVREALDAILAKLG